MAKKNENKIPATYWQNGNGATLGYLMHSDGQEALDMIHSVEDGLEKAIANETDAAIKSELEKAKKQIHECLLAFRRGFYGLSNEVF